MDEHSRFLLGAAAFFLLIVFPLLTYLKMRAVSNARMVVYFFVIYVLWYLPFAPIHEGSHYLAGRIVGLHASSCQFLPRFWKGDFINGYINWIDGEPWQIAFSCQGPYVIDAGIVLLGYLLLRRENGYGPFLGALILTQTFLRTLFDVAVNYSAGTLWGTGDFHYLFQTYPPVAVHVCSWAVMLLAGSCAAREIVKVRTLSS